MKQHKLARKPGRKYEAAAINYININCKEDQHFALVREELEQATLIPSFFDTNRWWRKIDFSRYCAKVGNGEYGPEFDANFKANLKGFTKYTNGKHLLISVRDKNGKAIFREPKSATEFKTWNRKQKESSIKAIGGFLSTEDMMKIILDSGYLPIDASEALKRWKHKYENVPELKKEIQLVA